MKKRLLSLLLSVVLLLSLSIPGVHAEAPESGSADISANVLHLGGLLPEGSQRLRSSTDNAEVKQVIYAGLRARAQRINISAYSLKTSDLPSVYQQVLNEHPDLFFVTGGLSWSYSGSYVTYVSPGYDSSYTEADIADYQNTVTKIIGMLGADWSDTEKLLFLHDYLVTHCEYDLSYSRYNAHDALVVGSSVCQGYAEAFCDLCLKSGIPCTVISSNAINHAWNLVTLGGENFYVDCTWDDPSNHWYEGYCSHSNFVLSKSAFAESHSSTDWTDSTTNVYTNDTSSTRFDGAWWSDVITAVPIIGHTGAYTTNSDSSNFYLRNMRTGETVSRPLPARAVWPVFGQQYSSWMGNYCSFTALNGLFYFTLPTEIFSASSSGETESVYKLTKDDLAAGYLYGIVADGNALYYNIGEQAYNCTFVRQSLQPQSGPVTGERDGFAYEVLPDGTASITDCALSGSITIPKTLDGYTVTNLASRLFYGKSDVTSVTIPASVTSFGTDPADNNWDYVFSYCYGLTRINVETGNPSFRSVDGVLFSKDGKTLIHYPCSRAGAVYHTQAQTICCTAFASSRNLKFLFLDSPATWWYTYTFYNDPALTVFYMPGGQAEQKADADRASGHVQDGKSGNPWCSLESTASLCTLPAGLQVIESEAFAGTEIPWIIAPAGCTRIETNAFADSGLAYLRVGKNTIIEGGALADTVVVERK